MGFVRFPQLYPPETEMPYKDQYIFPGFDSICRHLFLIQKALLFSFETSPALHNFINARS